MTTSFELLTLGFNMLVLASGVTHAVRQKVAGVAVAMTVWCLMNAAAFLLIARGAK